MQFIDIVILVLLLLGAINGFRKGIINQGVSVVALLLGVWGAIHFSSFTAKWLVEKFNLSGEYMPVVAFIVTFVLVVVAVHFVGKLVQKLAEAVALGWLNRLAGMLVGVMLWGFVVSVVLSVGNKFDIPKPEVRDKSILYAPVAKLAPAIFPYIKFDTLKKGLQELDSLATPLREKVNI